jgi:hypothetical protein
MQSKKKITTTTAAKSKRMATPPQDAMTTTSTSTSTTAANATVAPKVHQQSLLPKCSCVCNWKFCRTYQKYFCEYQHPLFCGVVKLKFTKTNPKSMAFQAVVERALRIPPQKRNEEPVRHYYVARHHFTQALMKQYLVDRRAWDWNEPLTLQQAKTYLWSLDRCDIYQKDDSTNVAEIQSEGEDVLYLQAPNVPKDQVRDCLRKRKLQFQKEKAIRDTESSSLETGRPAVPALASPSILAPPPPAKRNTRMMLKHSMSTSSSSVTDKFKGLGDFLGKQRKREPPQESLKLRRELSDCQEQLHRLQSMVKQLKFDVNRNKEVVVVEKDNVKDDKEEEEEDWIVELGVEENQDPVVEEGDEWVVVQGVLQSC